MVKTPVAGAGDSYRCGKCGGVWVQDRIVRMIRDEPSVGLHIRRYDLRNKKPEKNNNLTCPADGRRMSGENHDEMPPEVAVWKCHGCNWWWLPGNSVFELGEAFRIKTEYDQQWGIKKPVVKLMLPMLLLLLFVGSWLGAVYIFRNAQELQLALRSPIEGKISVIYLGENKAELKFKARTEIQSAMIRRYNDMDWSPVNIVSEGNFRAIWVDKVQSGEKLWLSLDQYVWRLAVGEKQ